MSQLSCEGVSRLEVEAAVIQHNYVYLLYTEEQATVDTTVFRMFVYPDIHTLPPPFVLS